MTSNTVFISDCEGPLSKNDNAFEITQALIPEGAYLFTLLSKYDDVLAEVFHKPGYRAGNTLKLILPFLKAYQVTNEQVITFSSHNILLLPGTREMLHSVRQFASTFIVSTSYEQYLTSLCRLIDFPIENVYSTTLDLDRYAISFQEAQILRQIGAEITHFPMIDIPENARTVTDFSKRDQLTINRLNEIFWTKIPQLECGKIVQDVQPIGGEEKAKAVLEIAQRLNCDLTAVVYVGDSITDLQALRLVKESGGLSISFNGNQYAVENAQIALLSENNLVLAPLVDIFARHGTQFVLNLVEQWSYPVLQTARIDPVLLHSLQRTFPTSLPQTEVVNTQNVKRLSEESSTFRAQVRGEAIGQLG